MGLGGQKLFEKNQFLENCEVECYFHSKKSKYFRVKYAGEVYNFCLSDHHGAYRGKLFTVITKQRTHKKARQVAWDMKEFLKRKEYQHY